MKRAFAVAFCVILGGLGVALIALVDGLLGWLLAAFLLLGLRLWAAPRPGDLKLLGAAVATLMLCAALFVAGLFLAWESAEVVVLRHRDATGRSVESRLWVVDLDGVPSVATGARNPRVAAPRRRSRRSTAFASTPPAPWPSSSAPTSPS